MKEPEHLAKPDFKEAADKIAFLQSQLSEEQKIRYATFVRLQEKEKEEQKQKAARAKAEYDQSKEQRPGAVKNYDPPIKIKDPYLRQLALNAQAESNKVATLSITQREDKLRFLEKLEQERQTPSQQHKIRQDFTRAAAAGKAKTEFEKTTKLDPAKEEAVARAIARVKEKEKEEEKQRGRADRHQGRSLSDTFNKTR